GHLQRDLVDAGVGLARARTLGAGPRVDLARQRESFHQRVHLVVVDVRHDLDAHALRPEAPQRGHAVVPQRRGVERGPVLAVDQVVDRRRGQLAPQRPRHLHERAPEQLPVEVVRPHRHLPVRLRHPAAVRSPALVVGRGRADRVADETQLLEVHVAERARAEQRAGEVEEHRTRRAHRAPAATRSASHFSSAAARRLGMCSVGQPSTGVSPLRMVRASTDLWSSSGPSPIGPNRVDRYHSSTGRSVEYPSAPQTWIVRSRTASTTLDTWALLMPSSARTRLAPYLSIFHAVWNVSSRAAWISVCESAMKSWIIWCWPSSLPCDSRDTARSHMMSKARDAWPIQRIAWWMRRPP